MITLNFVVYYWEHFITSIFCRPCQHALSAAAPIFRGYLADVDCRWNVIAAAVDDRTLEERGLEVSNIYWRNRVFCPPFSVSYAAILTLGNVVHVTRQEIGNDGQKVPISAIFSSTF